MLLRRVIEHVKAQNWTAVGLDFVIVVTGVFIGIQVSNWNAARVDATRQEALVIELKNDLRRDLDEIDIVSKVALLRYAAAETMANRVSGWRLPDEYPTSFGASAPFAKLETETPDDASDAIYFAQRYTGFDQERRTYNALIAGGDLTFLMQPGLAEELWRHYLHTEEWVATENLRQKVSQSELRQAFVRHGLSMFESVEWKDLDSIVASDPLLLGALKTVAWEAALQYEVAENIKKNTRDLIDKLETTP